MLEKKPASQEASTIFLDEHFEIARCNPVLFENMSAISINHLSVVLYKTLYNLYNSHFDFRLFKNIDIKTIEKRVNILMWALLK